MTLAPLAAIIALIAYRGWVLMLLWTWFVTPTLNLPVVGLGAAIGLSLVASALAYRQPAEHTWPSAAVFAVIHPTTLLACGWVLQTLI